MKIGGRTVGPLDPCFIVAEIGLNHDGDAHKAHRLIDNAATCGVDAVKFQKRDPKACLTQAALDAPYTGRNSFGATYGAHRAALELSLATWEKLKQHAEGLGLIFFGSAFDVPSLRGIAPLVAAVKIPSCDLTHVALLTEALNTELPLIVSTGMATEAELDRAVRLLFPAHVQRRLALLHCVSGYPVENADANLLRMLWLQRYAVPVGYSDHTRGIAISVAAAALGACIVERHFTLDRTAAGPDHAASLEPEGLRRLVRDIRKVEAALKPMREQPIECEMGSKKKLRKCAVATRDLPAGHVLTSLDIAWKSPEVEGAAPADLDIRSRVLRVGVGADEPLLLVSLLDKVSTLP